MFGLTIRAYNVEIIFNTIYEKSVCKEKLIKLRTSYGSLRVVFICDSHSGISPTFRYRRVLQKYVDTYVIAISNHRRLLWQFPSNISVDSLLKA